jgi:hypothetical protein
MQDQPQVSFETHGDTLANPEQTQNDAPLREGKRRIRGPQQKRARQAHALQALSTNARIQGKQVGGDIR